jgi:hypothetical protein
VDRGGNEHVAEQLAERPKEGRLDVAGDHGVPREGGGHHQRPDPVVWAAVPGEQAHPGESGTDNEVEDDPKAAIVQEVGPSEQRHEPESDRRGHDGHHRELRPGQPHPPSPMASRDMSALTIDRTPAGAKVEPSRGLQRCPPV